MSDERLRQVGWASDGVHVHLMGLVRREDWEFRYFTVPVFVREADSEPPAEPACEVCGGTGLIPRRGLVDDDDDDCPRGCREGRT